jgi:hypothetical protein
VWTVWAFSLGFAMLPLLGSIAGSTAAALASIGVCSVEHSTALPASMSDLDASVRLGDHGIHCALCATAAGAGAVLFAVVTLRLPQGAESPPRAGIHHENPAGTFVPEAPRPRGPPVIA